MPRLMNIHVRYLQRPKEVDRVLPIKILSLLSSHLRRNSKINEDKRWPILVRRLFISRTCQVAVQIHRYLNSGVRAQKYRNSRLQCPGSRSFCRRDTRSRYPTIIILALIISAPQSPTDPKSLSASIITFASKHIPLFDLFDHSEDFNRQFWSTIWDQRSASFSRLKRMSSTSCLDMHSLLRKSSCDRIFFDSVSCSSELSLSA